MTLPISGFYYNTMNAYFGYLDNLERQKLWNLFLQNNNIVNPSDTDPQLQAQFVHFVQGMYGRANEVESQVVLPPQEVEKRKILFESFDVILRMLNVAQQTVGVQSQLLIFLGKWQEEYTKMMTRVPLYTPNPTNDWQPDSQDASRFTIGFNNISIQEMSEYVATTHSPITLSNGDISFTLATDSITFTTPSTTDIVAITPSGTGFNSLSKAISDGFLSVYNTHSTEINTSITAHGTPNLPWRFQDIQVLPDDDDEDTYADQYSRTAQDAITKNRGEINARNQTMIENIRSKRQVIRDLAGTYQSTVADSREQISQLADLLTSLLESLKGVVQSIAK